MVHARVRLQRCVRRDDAVNFGVGDSVIDWKAVVRPQARDRTRPVRPQLPAVVHQQPAEASGRDRIEPQRFGGILPVDQDQGRAAAVQTPPGEIVLQGVPNPQRRKAAVEALDLLRAQAALDVDAGAHHVLGDRRHDLADYPALAVHVR